MTCIKLLIVPPKCNVFHFERNFLLNLQYIVGYFCKIYNLFGQYYMYILC